MSRCEFGLGFLILVTLWMLRHITTYGCYVWIFSSFNVMVYQVAKHSNVQPMVECCDRIQRKMICVQMFLYIANSHNRHKTATIFNHKLYYTTNTTYNYIQSTFCADDETRISFYNLVYFYNRQETVGEINQRLYFGSNTTSQCEFWIKYNL